MFNNFGTPQQMAYIQMVAALKQQYMYSPNESPPPPPPMFLNETPPPRPPPMFLNDDSSDAESEDDEQNRTLFCANLDERVNEELLYEVFIQAGPIESVRIPKDNTGRQRNFGFIQYIHSCTPPYAMQLFQGLALFRKTLNIKFQGSSQPPPLQRRSLPTDIESYKSNQNRRRSGGGDNSSLRGSNYPAYYDLSMNDSSPTGSGNPFKQGLADWTLGSSGRISAEKDRERISKHSSSSMRPHQNSKPYERRSGGDTNDRGRDQYRNHYNGGSRRSEQRSSQRR